MKLKGLPAGPNYWLEYSGIFRPPKYWV